jgi:hypothetical protein
MLFIIAAAVVLIAVFVLRRLSVPSGLHSSDLGWMSERWLAEHRASRWR